MVPSGYWHSQSCPIRIWAMTLVKMHFIVYIIILHILDISRWGRWWLCWQLWRGWWNQWQVTIKMSASLSPIVSGLYIYLYTDSYMIVTSRMRTFDYRSGYNGFGAESTGGPGSGVDVEQATIYGVTITWDFVSKPNYTSNPPWSQHNRICSIKMRHIFVD